MAVNADADAAGLTLPVSAGGVAKLGALETLAT
jgi:hypothetical protein